MSGLFQRIARRRAAGPDDASPSDAAAQPGAAQPALAAHDLPVSPDAPTRFLGAPASPAGTVPEAAAPPAADSLGRQQPTQGIPSPTEQRTVAHAAPGDVQAASAEGGQTEERRPGFRERGRMRRRLRYLRRLRELQLRDLGGLVFDLRRFERKRDDLLARKIDQLRASDDEIRALEEALADRRDVRDVRMPGIGGTCPRCFSLYGSGDRFCAHCGAALGGLAQGPAQVAAPPPPVAQPAPRDPAAGPQPATPPASVPPSTPPDPPR